LLHNHTGKNTVDLSYLNNLPPLQEEKHLEQKVCLKGVDHVSLEKGFRISTKYAKDIAFLPLLQTFSVFMMLYNGKIKKLYVGALDFFPTELGSSFTP